MPALWSPKDLAVRFAAYIEELHDVFVMHGLRYGSPDDICQLTARLQTPGPLNEELAALVRSMVLREGGSMPRTDLLEIVAIAIAGPRMDPAGEELQPAVRQLLSFLHVALRRPWNEPPGEERLHPEEDPRAEAARELREAAAKIEAEVQSAEHERRAEIQAPGEGAHAARANVIPFGRARAVFSRLARAETADPMEDDAVPEFRIAIGAGPVVENHIVPPSSTPTAQDTNQILNPIVPATAASAEIPDQPMQAAIVASAPGVDEELTALSEETSVVAVPNEAADIGSSPVPMTEPVAELLLPAFSVVQHPLPEGQAAALPALAEPIRAEAASVVSTATSEAGMVSGPEKVPLRMPPAAPSVQPMQPRAIHTVPLPEFDEEPPLPAAPHIGRGVFVYGIAAVVLLAAGLGFALRAGTATQAAAGSTSVASTSAPKLLKQSVTPTPGAVAPAGVAPADVGSNPTPVSQLRHESHFDDDYIAPPYSNVLTPEPQAAVPAPAPPASESPSPAPRVEEVSAKQVIEPHEPHIELARTRDPDASIVGDAPLRTSAIAMAEPPVHPHISAGLMAENLVSAPKPDYPALAKIAHVDGPVVLHAEINRKGEVADTDVISGHFLLRRAAEAAVKHWRYRPYQVNGKPVPVSTTITVRFRH